MTHGHAVATPHDHAVSFYGQDAEAVGAVAGYVADGLAAGDRVVVIATGPHRAALDAALAERDVDPGHARTAGRYLTLDAGQTLARFMVDGSPDPGRFMGSVGGVIRSAGEDGASVRAFGEMVALLWDDGNVAGALALESLWNDLAGHHEFSLLCAYPTTALENAPLADVNRVCDLHSSVVPPWSYDPLAPSTAAPASDVHCAVFVPVPQAVAAARRLVTDALTSWGKGHLLFEATLITSEMATNAVRHADSPFRASIRCRGGVIRIAVEDAGGGWPQRRPATSDGFTGRGVMIVEELSHRWGVHPRAEGKVTWAELATEPALHGDEARRPGATWRPGGTDGQ